MTYQEALALVHSEFETRYDSDHNEIIRMGLTYDGYSEFFISVYDEGDRVILTDLGVTKDVFYKVEEQTWQDMCRSCGFGFHHWHIERAFTSLDDVHLFIAFLNYIADTFCPIDG